MAQVKKYELEDDNGNEVHLEVDHSVLTKEAATEINEFWSDSEGRLDACNGDVTKAVLKLAFVTAIGIARQRGWGNVRKNNCDQFTAEFHEEEGWYECGIRITYLDMPEADFDDITIKVVS